MKLSHAIDPTIVSNTTHAVLAALPGKHPLSEAHALAYVYVAACNAASLSPSDVRELLADVLVTRGRKGETPVGAGVTRETVSDGTDAPDASTSVRRVELSAVALEQQLLGSALLYPVLLDELELAPAAWTTSRTRSTWRALQALRRSGWAGDLGELESALCRQGQDAGRVLGWLTELALGAIDPRAAGLVADRLSAQDVAA